MPYVKTIVCLANSRKPAGRCVAGKEVVGRALGNWIRPVSGRPGEEISEEERRYADGRDPRILDVVEIPLLEPRPHNHQRENHLIDDNIHWVHRATKTWDDIQAAVDEVEGPLWLNGHHSSRGQNDQVPENEIGRFQSSLYLVRPDNLTLAVATEDNFRGGSRRRIRADFELNGSRYVLVVTDPSIERTYLRRADGDYEVAEALMCVSLAEVFSGNAYKLAATIITPE